MWRSSLPVASAGAWEGSSPLSLRHARPPSFCPIDISDLDDLFRERRTKVSYQVSLWEKAPGYGGLTLGRLVEKTYPIFSPETEEVLSSAPHCETRQSPEPWCRTSLHWPTKTTEPTVTPFLSLWKRQDDGGLVVVVVSAVDFVRLFASRLDASVTVVCVP